MTIKMGSINPLRAIKIVSIVQIIWGVINVLNNLPWAYLSFIGEEYAENTTYFIVYFLLGVFYIIIGWGLWHLKTWAAQGTRILAMYGIISSILVFLSGYIQFFLIMHIGIYLVIRRQETKDVFLYGNLPKQAQYDIDDGIIDI